MNPFEAVSASRAIVRSLAGDPAGLRSYMARLKRAEAHYFHPDKGLMSDEQAKRFTSAFTEVDQADDDKLKSLTEDFLELGGISGDNYSLRYKIQGLQRELAQQKEALDSVQKRQGLVRQESDDAIQEHYGQASSIAYRICEALSGIAPRTAEQSILDTVGHCFFVDSHFQLYDLKDRFVQTFWIQMYVVTKGLHLMGRIARLEFAREEGISVTEGRRKLKKEVNRLLAEAESEYFDEEWEDLGIAIGMAKVHRSEVLELAFKEYGQLTMGGLIKVMALHYRPGFTLPKLPKGSRKAQEEAYRMAQHFFCLKAVMVQDEVRFEVNAAYFLMRFHEPMPISNRL